MSTIATYPRRFASLVKIEHTVFALPFAYVGAFLAVDAVPSAHDLVWITVAMVGARSLAMALNRLVDAEIDSRNPRTAGRELPAGRLTRRAGRRSSASSRSPCSSSPSGSSRRSCRWLWPIPVIGFVVYPYLKRVTWLPTCGSGPSTGSRRWVPGSRSPGDLPWQAWALGGAVAAWVAGFDLFYSLFDVEVDRARGPPLVGDALRRARRVRRGARLHVATVGLLVVAGLGPPVGVCYWIGVAVVAALLLVRALARPAGRPAPPRRRLLHRERRDQRRLLRLRPRGRPHP